MKAEHGIFVYNLADLGANKITAFEDRAQIKDIIDLYYITRQIALEQLFTLADQKRVPVAYENLLTINTTGISGQALLTIDLIEQDLLDFVDDLRLKTEAEIKKKNRTRVTIFNTSSSSYYGTFRMNAGQLMPTRFPS